MSWFNVEIPWGEFEVDSPGQWAQVLPFVGDVGNDGPPGPAYNSGWNTVEDNNQYNNYTFRPQETR